MHSSSLCEWPEINPRGYDLFAVALGRTSEPEPEGPDLAATGAR
jgi:hypothetical protein